MNRGRRNLRQAASEQSFTLEQCQSIAKVVLSEVPIKLRFVVIDHTGKEKAQESGSKVTSIVCKVLFSEQLRLLEKSPEWTQIFRDPKPVPADESSQIPISQQDVDGEIDSSDDDMPSLEANTNRLRPFGVQCDAESDSDS